MECAGLAEVLAEPSFALAHNGVGVRVVTDERLVGQLASRLSVISSAPQFRRVDDALTLLRDEYQRRIHACELLRAPGMRRKLVFPTAIVELLDVVENRERKTA